MEQAESQRLLYSERLLPGFGVFIATGLLLPAIALMLAPFSVLAGVIAGAIISSLVWVLLLIKAPVIEVSGETLKVGRASIPRKFLGRAISISAQDLFEQRGPKLDSRAYSCFQASVRGGVRVEIGDKNDPTPYWIFSTRRPQQLCEVLNKTD